MKIHNMEQRTPEWYEIRRGRITASEASKILTTTGRPSSSLTGYLCQVAAEYNLGPMREEITKEALEWGFKDPYGDFDTYWLKRGRMLEGEAAAWFKIETGLGLESVGFVTLGDRVGYSPDAIIEGTNIPVELKCPKPETHVAYMMQPTGLPKDYKQQVHFQMAVAGTDNAWFMSYCPGFAPVLVNVKRDGFTEKMAAAIEGAAEQLEDIIRRTRNGKDDR